jgi:hypothetical protein
MKSLRIFLCFVALSLLLAGAFAQAASITGTVTNKTNGKPSPGDNVVLVDVQAGMSDAASTTTDRNGHYSLASPGGGAYLIRVNHQGGTYFIAAPQGGAPGDVSVYDVAAKIDGIGIDADMILAEAAGGMLRIQERYLVRNTSLPPKAQFSSNTFEFVLPSGAILDGASATRPGGLPTNTRPIPLGQNRHYTINIPIQPDLGDKETLFEVQYHLSYSGKYTFAPEPQMQTDNMVVYLPKGMSFGASKGATFQSVEQDSRVQTFVAKNLRPGQSLGFTITGEGQMPREAQGGMGDAGAGDTSTPGNRPGGGIGNPIGTPDPLTSYKWWILGGLSLVLLVAVIFFLRRPVGAPVTTNESTIEARPMPTAKPSAVPAVTYSTSPAAGNTALLNILKEELFAIESEKLSGTISASEYAEVKAGLEAVLKRALKNPSK